jgi:hypothetical protein
MRRREANFAARLLKITQLASEWRRLISEPLSAPLDANQDPVCA